VRLNDPGLAALRRAGRVTIVGPLVFAGFLEIADLPIAALFGAFGAFSMLAFADYGGATWPRARAYLVLTAVGAGLLVIGSLLNPEPVPAALVAVLVAAGARFAGCFGGYFQASVSPIVLAYVLGVMVADSGGGDIDQRVLGWCTAGVLAVIAATVLWPRRERLVLRARVGTVATALGDGLRAVAASGRIDAASATSIRDSLAALEAELSQPRRPAGPGVHDVSFAYVVDQVRRLAALVIDTEHAAVPHVGMPHDLALAAATVVDHVATALATERVPAELVPAIEECEARRRAAAEHATRRVAAGDDVATVVDEVDAAFPVRVAAFLAASIGVNVERLVAGTVVVEDLSATPLEVPAGGLGGTARRLRTLIATHLVPTSTWAQESLRGGIAVGAAVLLALELDIDHGFWVVLGTLSVLRSNAFTTGRSALAAAGGTAVGFVITAGVLAIVGLSGAGLWIVYVVGIFLAAYTPQAVGFVVGQASFTLFVVALFNLIEPEGWRTGLVRVEDIAIGAAVSLAVGLLFWPRRAVHQLRASIAALYTVLAGALGPAFRGRPDSAPVRRAEQRAHAAYEAYLSEQLGAPPGSRPWGVLVATASQGRGAIVSLERHARLGVLELHDEVASALGAGGDAVGRAFANLSTAIRRGEPAAVPDGDGAVGEDPTAMAAATRAPVLLCVAAHAGGDEAAAALDAAFARDWLIDLTALIGPARRAAAEAAGR
jgi:hypothetical protein